MMTSEEMVKQQFKYFEWYSDSGTTEIHWSDLEKYLNLLRNQTLEEAAKVADTEEELDGPIPVAVWEAAHKDIGYSLRAAVIVTKKNISKRIRALKAGKP